MTTLLDQLASGQLAAPAFVEQIAKVLKGAEPILGPVENWAIDLAEKALAAKIDPNIAQMLALAIKTQLDLVPATPPAA